jgi:hypothetical protein
MTVGLHKLQHEQLLVSAGSSQIDFSKQKIEQKLYYRPNFKPLQLRQDLNSHGVIK